MNGHRPFSLGSGNWSKCPKAALALRGIEHLRCIEIIFRPPAKPPRWPTSRSSTQTSVWIVDQDEAGDARR